MVSKLVCMQDLHTDVKNLQWKSHVIFNVWVQKYVFLSIYIWEYLEFHTHTHTHTHTSSTQKEQNKEYIVFCSELKGYSQAHMR